MDYGSSLYWFPRLQRESQLDFWLMIYSGTRLGEDIVVKMLLNISRYHRDLDILNESLKSLQSVIYIFEIDFNFETKKAIKQSPHIAVKFLNHRHKALVPNLYHAHSPRHSRSFHQQLTARYLMCNFIWIVLLIIFMNHK